MPTPRAIPARVHRGPARGFGASDSDAEPSAGLESVGLAQGTNGKANIFAALRGHKKEQRLPNTKKPAVLASLRTSANAGWGMVPQEGFEPPTPSLRMRCSTS
ncbi:hypothetical protein BOS5A_230487 [Bosea sp. EC-HK365B]|nr:hypothetical protein BOSE7B_60102 [Bosea sp. 7B]VVT61210.1 hypothetical protein BOS5A_230487 [Bosea sp. EC-HK365B]VXB24480.1 hypothetical protein BOSE127_110102 [Bosea sp. 127]